VSTQQLRRRIRAQLGEQRSLTQSLLKLREQIRGSLFVRYGKCGKAECACQLGRGHGPYYVFSSGSRGRGAFAYLGEHDAGVAKQLIDRSRAFQAEMRRLKKVNEELLELLRRYQAAAGKRGARRLGIAVIAKNP
jgi:hypothetical protein